MLNQGHALVKVYFFYVYPCIHHFVNQGDKIPDKISVNRKSLLWLTVCGRSPQEAKSWCLEYEAAVTQHPQ